MEGTRNPMEKNKSERWEELVHKVDEFSRENPIPMDEGIKDTVVSLMANNFRTVGSCYGHLGEKEGTPYPWVAIRGSESIDALFDDERIQKLNEKYFDESPEEEMLSQEERKEIRELQDRMKISKENERQRLLALLEEFYSTRDVESGVRLTVIPLLCWLGSQEVVGVDSDEIRKKHSNDELEIKLEKYREEMSAFTQFLKVKFFAS